MFKRFILAGGTLLALAPVLVACGGSENSDPATRSSSAQASSAALQTITTNSVQVTLFPGVSRTELERIGKVLDGALRAFNSRDRQAFLSFLTADAYREFSSLSTGDFEKSVDQSVGANGTYQTSQISVMNRIPNGTMRTVSNVKYSNYIEAKDLAADFELKDGEWKISAINV